MPRGKHSNHRRGSQHYRWNERPITSHGYVLVRVPEDHPLHIGNGYAYEHRLVASEMLGRALTRGELVHHVNGDKADNRPENLQIVRRGEHNHLHLIDDSRRDPSTGRFTSKQAAGRQLDGREWNEMPEGAL